MKELKRLLTYARPHWRLMLLAFVCMVTLLFLGLIPPLILRTIVDRAIPARSLEMVAYLVGGYILVNLLLGIFNYGQWYSFELVGQRIARDLQLGLHNHLQRLHMEYFRKQKTGDIMSRVTEDVGSLHEFLGWGFILMTSNILSVVVTVGVMFWLSPKLTLATIAAFPALALVVLRFDKKIRPIWKQVREEMGKLTTVLQENVSGVRTVKAFARESHEIGKFGSRNKGFLGVNLDRIKVESSTQPLVEFISSLSIVGLVWYGGVQVAQGNESLGTLIAFQGYIWNIVWPIRMLGMLLNIFEQAMAAAPRVFQVLDTPAAIADEPGATTAADFSGRLEFREVSFQFNDGDSDVLKNVSFSVPPGKVLAIVGGTGSGKSTLVGLIPRFFDPQKGQVLIDGQDVRSLTLDSLRRQIGMVLQDTVLFSATIAENIAYGRPDATAEEIEHAARLAQADDFITALPRGYNTPIGERGVGLSGGQKQRVALARALLMNPRVLILDEATSSVDTNTEYLIQEGLSEVMKGRTSVVIAKRLSTIEQADYVVVIEQGEVVEQGTPEELLREHGYFRRMYLSQQRQTGLHELAATTGGV